jgi:hypothetical protein
MELQEYGQHIRVGVSRPFSLAYRRLGRSILRRFDPISRCASASTYRATNDDRFEHGASDSSVAPPSPHAPELVEPYCGMISPIRKFGFDVA